MHPLRHAVLRTGRRWSAAIYPADSDPLSAHFAAVLEVPEDAPGELPDGVPDELADGAIVLAVGSVLPEKPDWPDWDHPTDGVTVWAAWRVRGMAARADSRGSGIGTRILDALLAHVRAHGGGLVWCTARLPARSLYERGGFQPRGAPAGVPGLGAHQMMWVVVPEMDPDVGRAGALCQSVAPHPAARNHRRSPSPRSNQCPTPSSSPPPGPRSAVR